MKIQQACKPLLGWIEPSPNPPFSKGGTRVPVVIGVMVLLMLIFGCSNKSPLPKDMASMAQIYDEHFQETRTKRMELKDARERISRPLKNHGIDLDGYTRDAHNEIQGIFPELPNPTMVMYLFPHLAENGSPVPGYSTTFTMYDKTQYALPGEVGTARLE